MTRPSLLPTRLRSHPYAAAVYAGGVVTAVALIGYDATNAVVSQRVPPTWLTVLDLLVVAACLSMAWGIAVGRIATIKGLEWAASLIMCCIYWAALAEMVSEPNRAENLTCHCFLVLVAAGVVIRSRSVLVALTLGAVVSWTITVQFLDAPGFVPSQWAPTWAVAIAIAFAAQAVAGTERHVGHQARGEVRSTAWQDALTGLTNRTGFAPQATLLLATARRRDEPVWCAFVDVDHFKSVNDLLGHDAGDDVLKAVGSALRTVARASDVAARWGGDEFVLFGIGAAPDERTLQARVVAHLGSLDPAIVRVWTASVTVGVAGVTVTDDSDAAGHLADLMTAADKRMYERRRAVRAT